ncbi:hypothetical protein TNCV_2674751 [Trichonephila clavipes]|nr:hypothetical protein TNCV_2674751 [Trichonephila clavipes]
MDLRPEDYPLAGSRWIEEYIDDIRTVAVHRGYRDAIRGQVAEVLNLILTTQINDLDSAEEPRGCGDGHLEDFYLAELKAKSLRLSCQHAEFCLNCALQGHMESAHHFSRKRIDIVSDQKMIRNGTSTTRHRFTKGDYVKFYNPTRRPCLSPEFLSRHFILKSRKQKIILKNY